MRPTSSSASGRSDCRTTPGGRGVSRSLPPISAGFRETSKTTRVPLADDTRAEGAETVAVGLGPPGFGAALGAVTTTSPIRASDRQPDAMIGTTIAGYASAPTPRATTTIKVIITTIGRPWIGSTTTAILGAAWTSEDIRADAVKAAVRVISRSHALFPVKKAGVLSCMHVT